MKQYIAEQMLGESALHSTGRFVLWNTKSAGDLHGFLFAGVSVANQKVVKSDDAEMWECDVYIVPRRKLLHGKNNRSARISQHLLNDGLNPRNWGKVYFDVAKDTKP